MRAIVLCHASGIYPREFAALGWDVVAVDLLNGLDVRTIEHDRRGFDVVVAEPPCTEFAGSGARWWASKGEAALLAGLAVADACLRAVAIYNPSFWWLENPVGRLSRFYGPPRFTFHPHEFAKLADDQEGERYTKRTCIWGNVRKPAPAALTPTLGSKMHLIPPSIDRAAIRSKTPHGFARAMVRHIAALNDARGAA